MLSNQQNKLIWGFIPRHLILIVCIAIFLFLGSNALGIAHFEDDLDSYADDVKMDSAGDEWTSSCGNSRWWSVDDKVFTGTRAMNWTIWREGCNDITNTFTTGGKTNATTQFYMYFKDTTGGTVTFVFYDYNKTHGCSVQVDDGDVAINSWHESYLKTWFDGESNFLCSLDVGFFSTQSTGTAQTVSTTQLYISGSVGAEDEWIYLDDFQRYSLCDIDHCYNCLDSTTCEAEGCSWYFLFYKQIFTCIPPPEIDPEECGEFYKCLYCLTQEACEEMMTCFWTDIGLGDQCYQEEPAIPPSQVEWEVPELEECGELSGTEYWLCEIKNDIAGFFLPSQEKVNALYQTLGAFKDKFPINYISSMTSFFSEVTESLESTTTIPIEILGQDSEVNFTLWDATTTIGGEEESLKNILFDFTSVLVLFGWFTWLISMVRRFF